MTPEPHATTIAAVVLTLNEAQHIGDCLDTLAWADDRLVFDSFSADATLDIARRRGARVIQNRFQHYGQQRNDALAAVKTDWVFFLDADERCTPALAEELRQVAALAGDLAHAVWAVPRHNFLFGKLTLGAGWYPDFQARLFRVGQSGYDPDRQVHELPVFAGEMGYLKHELIHFNYQDVAQFHAKQRQYAQYDADMLFKQGVRPKPQNYVLQPLREFKRRFISLKGYRDGPHGLRLSLLTAYYNFDMYRRLRRLWAGADPL